MECGQFILINFDNKRLSSTSNTVTPFSSSRFVIQCILTCSTMVLSPKEYIERNIGSWVLADPEFNGKYSVLSTTAKTSDHLDGFMSTIFMCDVFLQAKEDRE